MARRRAEPTGGFTLVETLVALGLLVVLAVGVVSLLSVAAAATHTAARLTTATLLAVQKMEQLRDQGDPIVSPAGTLDRNIPGFVDYLDAEGHEVGAGAAVPPAARFIRRWAVDPLPVGPEHAWILQVLVTTPSAEAQLDSRALRRGRQAGEVRLATLSRGAFP